MIKSIQNLVLNGLFVFKIISKNSILTSIKGCNSVAQFAKIRTHRSFRACHHNLQVWKGSDKNSQEKSGHIVFFHYNPLSVAMKTRSRIWPNFKLIQALMSVIVTCKYEMDSIMNSREEVATPFFPIISIWGFFQTLKGSSLHSRWWSDLNGFQTPLSSHAYHHYLEV